MNPSETDSAAQLRPYLLAAEDPEVYERLAGAVARHARYVLVDPYANGFNDGPTGAHSDPEDIPEPSPWVWERKYEVDSLAAVLQFAYALWKASEREGHLDGTFREAAERIVEVWRLEQSHHENSTYRFIRPVGPWTGDTLPNDGKGGPVANTGMTWSGFRPSDDRCEYGYLIPANAMASTGLHDSLGRGSGGPTRSSRSWSSRSQASTSSGSTRDIPMPEAGTGSEECPFRRYPPHRGAAAE